MNVMKQKAIIQLRAFMERDDGWGNEEGREVHQKLLRAVENESGKIIFRISLKGIRRTDASFPRESVVELARRFRGQKGFCLIDISNPDLMENWDAAALKRQQPLTVWHNNRPEVIGPAPSRGNKVLLDYILSAGDTTAATVAKELNLKLANASSKLRQLFDEGFILRRNEVSPTGGVEYHYFRVG
jgi:hypothetical protein